jgi:hypothetical protein
VKNTLNHLNMKGAVPRLISVFVEMLETQQWPQDQEISHRWIFLFPEVCLWKPGHRSQYSDLIRARKPRGRISSPGRDKFFLLSTPSRPVLGPTQSHIQWKPGTL